MTCDFCVNVKFMRTTFPWPVKTALELLSEETAAINPVCSESDFVRTQLSTKKDDLSCFCN